MSLSAYSSTKIRVLSLISIILVVFLHAYNLEGVAPFETPLHFQSPVWCLQDFVSYGLTRVAVPMFFLFSGFLFFLHHDGPNVFLEKMRKRVSSLLVPFLCWSLFGIAFYFTLQTIPQTAVFFTKQRIADFTLPQWLYTIFIQPIPYQFWFVRDLMVLVILSPVLFKLLRFLGYWWVLLLIIPWLMVQQECQNSSEAALFFCTGGYFAIKHPAVASIRSGSKALWSMPLWLLLLAVKTMLLSKGVDWFIVRLLFKASILIGLLAVWSLYDRWVQDKHLPQWLLNLCGFTFFIYAAHEPLLTIFKKILFVIFGTQQGGALLVYIGAPLLTLCCTSILGWLLRTYAKGFYERITGGR